MIRVPFNDDWAVGPKLGAFEAMGGAADPQPVTLPHDAQRDLPRSADSDQGVHAGIPPGRGVRVLEELRGARASGARRPSSSNSKACTATPSCS